MKGRTVCRGVFLMYYPIGSSTLYTLQRRRENGEKGAPYAHDKIAQQGVQGDGGGARDQGALSVIGWYLYYSQQVSQLDMYTARHAHSLTCTQLDNPRTLTCTHPDMHTSVMHALR